MQINNPTTFSTPDLTLSTSNSSGSAGALRADDTILVYDATVPDAITFGQSGAAGSAATSSRRDHAHAMASETAVPVATQAQQETGTSTVVFVTSGRQQFHDSAIKVWCHITAAGALTDPDYGVESITDTSQGKRIIIFTNDFDNITFAPTVSSSGGNVGFNGVFYAPAVDQVKLDIYLVNDDGSSLQDYESGQMICGRVA